MTATQLPTVDYTLSGTVVAGNFAGSPAVLRLRLDQNQLDLTTACGSTGLGGLNATGTVGPSTLQIG